MAPTTASDLAKKDLVREKSTLPQSDPHTRDGLHSEWEKFYYPHESGAQGRWQGEIDSLVVYGAIPRSIEGTFYRIIIDPHTPPHPENGFVEGDGNVCAVRIQDGKASLKMRYVETERWQLERAAGRRLFGIYRNPYTNDASVRYANDTTGNTNIIYWAGHVLCLAERGLPWAIDPDTLETRGYDPFAGQVRAKTFTAHPKVDPRTDELVVWGAQAKGLGSTEVVTYSITAEGLVKDVNWLDLPEVRWIHDGWITENWIILSAMPFFYRGEEALKAGSQHWEFRADQPQIMVIAPRRPSSPAHPDWKAGEWRQYRCDHGLVVHAGAAWEDEKGNLQFESPWGQFNIFTFWNPADYVPPKVEGSYVRWTVDPGQPSDSKITKIEEILPWHSEFPVFDDRFNTMKGSTTFMVGADVLDEKPRDRPTLMPNSILKLESESGRWMVWHAGEGGQVSEPAFIPRSDDAPEGDGWLLFATARAAAPRGEMVILDTNDFSRPVAVIQMPFVLRDQLHGNWVPNPSPGTRLPRLTRPVTSIQPSAVGPLNRI